MTADADKSSHPSQRSPLQQPWTPRDVLLCMLALLGVLFLRDLCLLARTVEPLPYSEFLLQLKAGPVESVEVSAHQLRGSPKTPLADGRKRFVPTRVEPAPI